MLPEENPMAIKVKSFVSRNKKYNDKFVGFSTKCVQCKKVLNTVTTGMHQVKNGHMCDDCYYDGLGGIVEK